MAQPVFHVSSLWDSLHPYTHPALARWAKLDRPFGIRSNRVSPPGHCRAGLSHSFTAWLCSKSGQIGFYI